MAAQKCRCEVDVTMIIGKFLSLGYRHKALCFC